MTKNKIITDREVVLGGVRNDGWALEFADDSLKADREVVLEAVKQVGFALEFADDTLKADREFVREAVKESFGNVLLYASEELQNDPELKKLAEGSISGAMNVTDPEDGMH